MRILCAIGFLRILWAAAKDKNVVNSCALRRLQTQQAWFHLVKSQQQNQRTPHDFRRTFFFEGKTLHSVGGFGNL